MLYVYYVYISGKNKILYPKNLNYWILYHNVYIFLCICLWHEKNNVFIILKFLIWVIKFLIIRLSCQWQWECKKSEKKKWRITSLRKWHPCMNYIIAYLMMINLLYIHIACVFSPGSKNTHDQITSCCFFCKFCSFFCVVCISCICLI